MADSNAHGSRAKLLKRVQLSLTCLSIAANALCAGGIFTFPLMSPALAEHLKLTQPQLTTIVLAGMIGQYPFAAVVGKAIDTYGPWLCSLISALLFSSGFGLFAAEIARTPDDITAPSRSSFERLTLYYFMAGLGTVFSCVSTLGEIKYAVAALSQQMSRGSRTVQKAVGALITPKYFSSLFAASKNFPEYIGVASGTSMALFGLSPLFLSVLASSFFTDPINGLDVTHYAAFVGILAGVVHVIGAINLRTPRPSKSSSNQFVNTDEEANDEEPNDSDEESEQRPFLRKSSSSGVQAHVIPVEDRQSVKDLLRDPHFWLLALIVMFSLGSCEMVISNVGTIVISLPPSSSASLASAPSSAIATSTQVRLLSLANTVSRLLVGPLADFISPIASLLPCGTLQYPRKHIISRMSFMSGSAILLFLTFGWMGLGIRSQQDLWLLSIGTGIAYGSVFTVLPSIVSSVWGLNNLGRNFGVITYAPFIGTPFFSYLYAFVSASHVTQGNDGTCKGRECWQLTFAITCGASILSLMSSIYLWKRWKGRM